MTGTTSASSRRYEGSFEFGRMVFSLGKAAPPDAALPALLKLELQSDKELYAPGEFITLRGYAVNVGERPFLLQTRYPFLEGRLVDRRARDAFPTRPPVVRLRYSDFTRLDPGGRVPLFEERFLAGRWDPHWGIGVRTEFFPAPFAGPDREIVLRLRSEGLFPDDLMLRTGVWAGEAESNSVSIRVARPTAVSAGPGGV